jgi:hypothetical protein
MAAMSMNQQRVEGAALLRLEQSALQRVPAVRDGLGENLDIQA